MTRFIRIAAVAAALGLAAPAAFAETTPAAPAAKKEKAPVKTASASHKKHHSKKGSTAPAPDASKQIVHHTKP